MKITIYTVNDCEYSKQEKAYLQTHNLQFEEKNLETNKEFLTEMLVVGDNFAGTPVTKIEKDDGQAVVLKGFTQSEFDEALGFKVEAAPAEPAAPPTPQSDLTQTPPTTVVNPPTDLSQTPPGIVTPTNEVLPTDSSVVQPPAVINPPVQLSQDPPAVDPTPPAPTPAVPTPPEPTPPPTVPEPPKAPDDPKLASVLSNLQSMSSTPSSDAPTTSPAPTASMPSVPDPTFS